MAGGRPQKNEADKGKPYKVVLYTQQLDEIEKIFNDCDFSANRSEMIRASISLLKHFDKDFIKEEIISQRV